LLSRAYTRLRPNIRSRSKHAMTPQECSLCCRKGYVGLESQLHRHYEWHHLFEFKPSTNCVVSALLYRDAPIISSPRHMFSPILARPCYRHDSSPAVSDQQLPFLPGCWLIKVNQVVEIEPCRSPSVAMTNNSKLAASSSPVLVVCGVQVLTIPHGPPHHI
jgi:hypothetical protein